MQVRLHSQRERNGLTSAPWQLLLSALGWWLLAILLCLLVGCAGPRDHIAKAKKLAGTPPQQMVEMPQSGAEPLDLRSPDIVAERYLPVLERLDRRQQTIRRVLNRQPAPPRR